MNGGIFASKSARRDDLLAFAAKRDALQTEFRRLGAHNLSDVTFLDVDSLPSDPAQLKEAAADLAWVTRAERPHWFSEQQPAPGQPVARTSQDARTMSADDLRSLDDTFGVH